jgi:hypothetical protein
MGYAAAIALAHRILHRTGRVTVREGRRRIAESDPWAGGAYLPLTSVFDAGTQSSSGLPTRTFSFPN